MIKKTLIIPDECAGSRLDQALPPLLQPYSRTQIKTWIESGAILIDQKPAKPKLKLHGGETISVNVEEESSIEHEPEDIPLSIIYEDEALIVLNKPAGMVVHPGAGQPKHTLVNALLHHCPSLKALPRAGLLHRLDKDTSGLLLVAKNLHTLKNLSGQLKKRTILREYQAIVNGLIISGGKIDAPLARHHLQRKQIAVNETGKPAVTHYRVAERYRKHTRLTVRLETGRTHQIRVHMTHIRHSLVGDPTYGERLRLYKGTTPELAQCLRQFKRQALHAAVLGFTHPDTHEEMRFESPLPEDMEYLIEALRQDLKEKK